MDISIIVSSWNRADFIGDALTSIKEQTFAGETQVIVCDDGSTDGTPAVVEEFRNCFSDFKVIQASPTTEERLQTSRLAIMINRALKECSGKYITFLPDDDIYLPERNKMMFDYMESHPDIFLAYHYMKLLRISKNKAVVGQAKDLCEPWTESLKFWVMNIYNRIDHTSLFYKNLFEKNIPWNEDNSFRRCQDWGFLLRVLADGALGIGYIPRYLAVGRKIEGESLNLDGDEAIRRKLKDEEDQNLLRRG